MKTSKRVCIAATATGLLIASVMLAGPAQADTTNPTATPTASATPAPTTTASPTATAVPTPVDTSTPVPTATPAPVATEVPSAAPSPSSAPSTSDSKVWFVGSPDESFVDQVQRSIAADPSSLAAWTTTLSGLQDNIQAGNDVSLPGDAGTSAEELTQVDQALASVQTATSQQSKETARTKAQSKAAAPAADPDASPDAAAGTTYELRGFAINTNTGWEVKTEIDGGTCDPLGCEITDATRQTWKITPGRTGSTFNFTSTRSGSGNLSQIYANLSVVCGSTVCGTGSAGKTTGPQDGSGSGSPIVAHTSSAGGKQIDRVQMHAHFNPNGATYYDSVKTGTASCGSGSNYACKF